MDIVFTDFSGPLNPPVEKVGLAIKALHYAFQYFLLIHPSA